jgi:hypothetical protein
MHQILSPEHLKGFVKALFIIAASTLYEMLVFFIVIFTVTLVIISFSQNCQTQNNACGIKTTSRFCGFNLAD